MNSASEINRQCWNPYFQTKTQWSGWRLEKFKSLTLQVDPKETGFVYEMRKNKAMLVIEGVDNVCWRHSYLGQLRKFRSENQIFCSPTNPLWIQRKQSKRYGQWRLLYLPAKLSWQDFLPVFTAVGLHAGNESGYVPTAKFVFLWKAGMSTCCPRLLLIWTF